MRLTAAQEDSHAQPPQPTVEKLVHEHNVSVLTKPGFYSFSWTNIQAASGSEACAKAEGCFREFRREFPDLPSFPVVSVQAFTTYGHELEYGKMTIPAELGGEIPR